MGKGPYDSKTLFHGGTVVGLTTRKTFAVERDDIQVFVVGAIFGRLGKESTNA